MLAAKDDVGIMDLLVLFGFDEIRAAYLMEEMCCPRCNSEVYPMLLVRIPMNKHIHVGYLCRQCRRYVFYDVTQRNWDVKAPQGWEKNILGLNIRTQNKKHKNV